MNRSVSFFASLMLSACGQTQTPVGDSHNGGGAGYNTAGHSAAGGIAGGGVAAGATAGMSSAGSATQARGPDAGISSDASAIVDASPDIDSAAIRPRPIRALQITVGAMHACALLENHAVKCWGDNFVGQLGYGDTVSRGLTADEMGDALPFIDLGTGRSAKAIAAGRYTSCAILDDDTVKCWGYNEGYDPSSGSHGAGPGEMGDQLPIVDLGAGRSATHVALEEQLGCILLDNGTARCWGLAQPSYDFHPTAPVRQVTPGRGAVVILLQDGTVTSLPPGLADPTAGATAIGGSTLGWCSVGSPRGLTCTPPELAFPVPGAKDLIGVGLGDTASRFLCTLRSDGEVRCWGLGGCGGAAPFWCVDNSAATNVGDVVNLGRPATAITTGSRDFECALLDNGRVKCWGDPSSSFGVIGGSVEIRTDAGAVSYGAWNPIDLGTLH